LPNDAGEVPADQMEQFNADPTAFIDAVAEQLNGLSTNQWDPDLATLDAVIASLQIEGMTPSGLLDKTWEWTRGPSQPGSSEIIDVPDPTKYQVTYGSDGTINYVADCNVGSMPFELNNAGMTGGMLAQPGPMTLAECGPESLSNAFASSLQASQSYRVWAGGNVMELVLPAGGGFLLFRAAGASEPEAEQPPTEGEQACVTGTITYLQRIALPEDAVVQVQIQDTSLADVAAEVIGEQIITSPGQVPIAYEVCYDPSVIQDGHTYTMSARITDAEGNLLWINDTSIPVITNGNPTTDVEIPVIQVGG
jgi:putative lipoprotein